MKLAFKMLKDETGPKDAWPVPQLQRAQEAMRPVTLVNDKDWGSWDESHKDRESPDEEKNMNHVIGALACQCATRGPWLPLALLLTLHSPQKFAINTPKSG